MGEVSELEAAILRELQNNARRTNRAVAEAVHFIIEPI
jgi:DNA-binding Lrp family transcriptional regulator